MTISFNEVPAAVRVPFLFAEIDNSQAQQGPALLPYRVLIIGQKTASGAAADNSLQRVTNVSQVVAHAGRGSMLHRQALAYFANNKFTETYIGVVPDNGAGVAASGTITVSGPATAAGTLNVYLGGTLVQVAVASGDSANTIATNLNAAINANLDLPVTSTVLAAAVTVTFRHKGVVGNGFDMRANYQDGERYPTGVSLAFVAMASGTTNPTLTTLIAALGDSWFQVWAFPYTDATSLTAIETELSSRFSAQRMIDGVAFTAASGTAGTLGTLGDGRNSPHVSIVSQPGENPITPPMEIAASVAAVVALAGNADPARPFQTLPLVGDAQYRGALPPAETDLFTEQERNLLLFDGISTTKKDSGGVVRVNRLITTYKTNAAGASDESYLDVNTMLTLLYLRFSFRNRILTRYPRHKLANDGTRFGAGQAVITPMIGRAEALAWFRDMEELGLVENFDQFKRDLVVERDAQNVTRLNWLLPPNLINQFIVGAAKIQFLL